MKKAFFVISCLALLVPMETKAQKQRKEAKQQKEDFDLVVERYIRESFASVPGYPGVNLGLMQDYSQAMCSKYKDEPPPKVFDNIREIEQATMKYPSYFNGDWNVIMEKGDWKRVAPLAKSGRGFRAGKLVTDPADIRAFGNCQACHMLEKTEVVGGNFGPPLTHYGKIRGTSPEVIKYTYEKIYNAWAYVPCSSMPRFGFHGLLSPEQIADFVHYLLSPDSPINK
ncbi:MAG: sulfur oxidation c-type cytochrome SoxX [Aquificaceae bacterium]